MHVTIISNSTTGKSALHAFPFPTVHYMPNTGNSHARTQDFVFKEAVNVDWGKQYKIEDIKRDEKRQSDNEQCATTCNNAKFAPPTATILNKFIPLPQHCR